MINLKKLEQQTATASAQAATAELDRMISLHEQQAIAVKNRIKRYLYNVAMHPNGERYYKGTDGSLAISMVQHAVAAEALKELKAELEGE